MTRKIRAAALLALPCAVAFGQGEGPPPEDVNTTREYVNWLTKELGTSDDGMTIRESIDATDSMIFAVIAQMATEEDVAAIQEELGKNPIPTNEDIGDIVRDHLRDQGEPVTMTMFLWTIGTIIGVFVAVGIAFSSAMFRHGVTIGTLRNKIDGNNSDA